MSTSSIILRCFYAYDINNSHSFRLPWSGFLRHAFAEIERSSFACIFIFMDCCSYLLDPMIEATLLPSASDEFFSFFKYLSICLKERKLNRVSAPFKQLVIIKGKARLIQVPAFHVGKMLECIIFMVTGTGKFHL